MISTYIKRCLPKGVDRKSNRKAELIEFAKENSISTEIEVIYKIMEGWIGKPKGMLQILWEHGFID